MKRTLIHNATIVNEGQSVQGSVVIENGRIAEVLTNWKPLFLYVKLFLTIRLFYKVN